MTPPEDPSPESPSGREETVLESWYRQFGTRPAPSEEESEAMMDRQIAEAQAERAELKRQRIEREAREQAARTDSPSADAAKPS